MNTDDEGQNRVEKMMEIAEELGSMKIEDAMFFVPDDFRKLEGKGRWVLHVKEGKLVKMDEKKKEKSKEKAKTKNK